MAGGIVGARELDEANQCEHSIASSDFKPARHQL
jgi:hypothetical protein